MRFHHHRDEGDVGVTAGSSRAQVLPLVLLVPVERRTRVRDCVHEEVRAQARRHREVERCLREMWVPEFHYEFVKRTVTMAMDRNARGCEAASYLISFLFGRRMLITDEIGKGFERLFEVIDDLKVDVPNAERILAQFVARAVVDEVLPPTPILGAGPATLQEWEREQQKTW